MPLNVKRHFEEEAQFLIRRQCKLNHGRTCMGCSLSWALVWPYCIVPSAQLIFRTDTVPKTGLCQ
uniref:Uncharacterized protein n=1 Tax=Anguilla anguilla TaxID=7936 RepID=A0A0E9TV90_ANGAN